MKITLTAPVILVLVFLSGISFGRSADIVKEASANAVTPPADSFALSVSNAINKVVAIAVNPKRPALDIASKYLYTAANSGMYYSSQISITGSIKTYLIKTSTNRIDQTVTWRWESVLLGMPKGTQTEKINIMKAKADSIINAMPAVKEADIRSHISSVSTHAYINEAFFEGDSLFLMIYFTKPALNTEKQALDSLQQLYSAGLYNESTAASATAGLCTALEIEGVSEGKMNEIFAGILLKAASISAKTAFKILMNVSYKINTTQLLNQLPDNQRTEVRDMATKFVNDFNQQWSPPVVQEVKPSENAPVAKVPLSDCEKKIASLRLGIGKVIRYRLSGSPELILDYNCEMGKYAVMARSGVSGGYNTIQYKTPADLEGYQTAYSLKPCPVCNSWGFLNGEQIIEGGWTDWKQMGGFTKYKTYMPDSKISIKVRCKECKGRGFVE